MNPDQPHNLLQPLPTGECTPTGMASELEAVGSPQAALAAGGLLHDPVLVPATVDDGWLDGVADALVDQGWVSLDATPAIGHGLLSGLVSEVVALQAADALRSAGIGRGGNYARDRSVRRDRIAWLEGHTAVQQALFGLLESVRAGLNRRLFLNLRRFEAHYATYGEGDFYRRHLDSFRGRASRVVSLVLYLNEGWQPDNGGALRIYHREQEQVPVADVLPESGRVVLFMSEDIPHEVLPAHTTRYSLACWFRQDEVPVPLTGL